MKIDTDNFSPWVKRLTLAIPIVTGVLWPTFNFVRDTIDVNEAVATKLPQMQAAIDSLRLESYATRLLQQGRALEYNPIRFLDSIKQESK